MIPFHIYLYGPDGGPLPSSFEGAAARLERIDRLFIEPDGSLVWTCDSPRQQVDGVIYDAADRIQYVDLQGCCTLASWRTLLAALAPELGQRAVVLSLPDRRRQFLQAFETSTFGGTEKGVR